MMTTANQDWNRFVGAIEFNRPSWPTRHALAVLAFLLVIGGGEVCAQPAVGEGVGTYTCAEFLRAIAGEPDREELYLSWAQGWLTGWNLAQQDSSRPTVDLNKTHRPVEDIKSFVRKYCDDHRSALYMEAVYRYYFSLKGAPN